MTYHVWKLSTGGDRYDLPELLDSSGAGRRYQLRNRFSHRSTANGHPQRYRGDMVRQCLWEERRVICPLCTTPEERNAVMLERARYAQMVARMMGPG